MTNHQPTDCWPHIKVPSIDQLDQSAWNSAQTNIPSAPLRHQSPKNMFSKLTVLALLCALVLVHFAPAQAGDKGDDTIILGGEHGCGPKLLLKSGGKKKGQFASSAHAAHSLTILPQATFW